MLSIDIKRSEYRQEMRAEALRDAIGAPWQTIERADYEQAVAAVRDHLGESALIAAWTQGRAMTTEQVLTGYDQ